MVPSLVFYSASELLEGPVFDSDNHLLYFVSILDNLAYCYNPDSHEILSMKLDSPVSCIFPQANRKVIAASKTGFYELDFSTLTKKFAFQINIEDNVRYNDGIEDASGRIIIGTMGYPEVKEKIGKVYSYYKGTAKTLINDTTISNGLAFNPDESLMYFIDTPTKKVARYLYEPNNGHAQFDSYVIELNGKGSPDGMCMDQEGMLWIAEWGGACVSRWDPANGNKLDEIKLPCENVTSCCFDHLNNLYVTTAQSQSEDDLYGGGLFYVELNNS